jgi:hypothetical protein
MQNLKTSGLKDSIRVAHFELGNIHHKYGYCGQALNVWEKSYEASSSDEDIRRICTVIMKTAFVSQNLFYLNRFCEKARYLNNQNQP